jgi:predicted secreted protein
MAGVDAFGTTWAISTDGGSTFTAVADVTNIDVLNIKVDTIDVSSHDSADQWREFIGGMKDAGELSMDVNYDPAAHGTIFSNAGGDPIPHKITLTDAGAAVVTFDAVISGLKAQAPYDDKLSATVTLKVSGAPVITP